MGFWDSFSFDSGGGGGSSSSSDSDDDDSSSATSSREARRSFREDDFGSSDTGSSSSSDSTSSESDDNGGGGLFGGFANAVDDVVDTVQDAATGGRSDSRDSGPSGGGSSSRSDTGGRGRDRDSRQDSRDTSPSGGGGLGATIGGAIDEGIDRARDFAEDVEESTTVDEQVGGAVDEGVDRARDFGEDVSETVDEGVDTVRDVASDPVSAAEGAAQAVDESTRADEHIARGIEETGRRGKQALEDMGRAADDEVAKRVEQAEQVAGQVGGAVDTGKEAVEEFGEDYADEAKSNLQDRKETIDEGREAVEDFVEDPGGAIDRQIQREMEVVDEVASSPGGQVIGSAGAATQDFIQAGTALVQGDPERVQAEMASAGQHADEAAQHFQPIENYVDQLAKGAAGGPTPHSRMVTERYGEGLKTPPKSELSEDMTAEEYREKVAEKNPGVSADEVVFDEQGNPHTRGGGLQARIEREEKFAERAERGWERLTGEREGKVSEEEAGAMVFQGAEMVERSLMDAGHAIRQDFPTQGQGPTIWGDPIGSWPGIAAEAMVGGAGAGIGAFGQVGVTATADVTEPSVGQEQDSGTPTEQSGGVGDMFVRGGEKQIEWAQEHPGPAMLMLAAPTIEAGTSFVRGYRSPRGSFEVPYRSITDEAGAQGKISRFKTEPGESTAKATSEVRSRAADQPTEITEATGFDRILYHTTGGRLGRKLEVGEGASELPGLFTAPDVNPVGLRNTAIGKTAETVAGAAKNLGEMVKPRMPDWSLTPDRIAGFGDTPIRGMPQRAQGAAYEVRAPSGEVIARGLGRGQAKKMAAEQGKGYEVAPDQTTGGYDFLTEQADPNTAYVRPRGSRTGELEAIYPPRSEFVEVPGARGSARVGGREFNIPFTERTINLGGERIPMDMYRGAGKAPETVKGGGKAAKDGAKAGGAEPKTRAEIAESYGYNPNTGTAPTAIAGTGSVYQDLADLYGDGRVTGGDSRPTSTGETSPTDAPTDPTSTGGDPDLPHEWQRGSARGSTDRGGRSRDTSGESTGSETTGTTEPTSGYDGGYQDPYDQYVDDVTRVDETVAETGSRITSGSPRVTGGSPTGGSPTGGSPTGGSPTGGSPTGGSPTGGGPTSDPPYPPTDIPEPPRYPTEPPTSPAMSPTTPPPSDPYYPPGPPVPPTWPGWRPPGEDDDEVTKQQFGMALAPFSQMWVNPVADAETAVSRLLEGSSPGVMDAEGGDWLESVREDLERLG